MSTESAGPVSAPAHSLPAGNPPTSGSHGILGFVGPSHVGVSALRYPSGQADPLDIGGQMLTSSATGIVVAEIHAEREPLRGSRRLLPPPYGCRQKVLHMIRHRAYLRHTTEISGVDIAEIFPSHTVK